MSAWGAAALGYHVLSRLAYVVSVGIALARERRSHALTRRYGVEGAFRRFRRMAALVMNNDAVSFVVVCVLTRGTLAVPLPAVVVIAVGGCLIVLGIAAKAWAASTLGRGAFYWYDFFRQDAFSPPDPPGPYRYVRNPMYTVGYAHAYGIALILWSWPGLIAAAFDHVAVLVFYRLVEGPHVRELAGGAARGSGGEARR